MGIIYAIVVRDINVPYFFLDKFCQRLRLLNSTESGYSFIILILMFAFKYFRTNYYSFIISKITLSKLM